MTELKQRFRTALTKAEWAKLIPYSSPKGKGPPKSHSIYPSVEKFKRLKGRDNNKKPNQQSLRAIVRLVKLKINHRARVPWFAPLLDTQKLFTHEWIK